MMASLDREIKQEMEAAIAESLRNGLGQAVALQTGQSALPSQQAIQHFPDHRFGGRNPQPNACQPWQ